MYFTNLVLLKLNVTESNSLASLEVKVFSLSRQVDGKISASYFSKINIWRLAITKKNVLNFDMKIIWFLYVNIGLQIYHNHVCVRTWFYLYFLCEHHMKVYTYIWFISQSYVSMHVIIMHATCGCIYQNKSFLSSSEQSYSYSKKLKHLHQLYEG